MKFVQDDGHSLREAQEHFGVTYQTLIRYIKARQTNTTNTLFGYAMPGKSFSDNLQDLAKHAKKPSQNFYGVSYYDFSTACISTWNRKQCSNAPLLKINGDS